MHFRDQGVGKKAKNKTKLPRNVETAVRFTLAALDLWKNRTLYKPAVYVLLKNLDEEVARLHLEKIGVKLTKLTKDQSDYLGVPVSGPYKPSHYRY